MDKYCEMCKEFYHVNESHKIVEYLIKKTKVQAEITLLICCNCGGEIYDKDVEIANDVIMFDEYKRINGLLTSKNIVSIRERYQLSQTTLSKLLGFGQKTITRYENGAIQDRAHDNLMKVLFMEDMFYILWLHNQKYLTSRENDKITRIINKMNDFSDKVVEKIERKE